MTSAGPARPQWAQAETEIRTLLQAYFDGLYHGSPEELRGVFHPQALYATAASGELLHLNLPDYLDVVARRATPASRGDQRQDRIDFIEVLGPHTAFAQVRCAMLGRHYIDLLSLIQVDGRWQVIAKVFHYDQIA